MAIDKTQPLIDVRASIKKMISAHEAIAKGIATHAQKQNAKHDAARREAEQQIRIAEGAKRQNA